MTDDPIKKMAEKKLGYAIPDELWSEELRYKWKQWLHAENYAAPPTKLRSRVKPPRNFHGQLCEPCANPLCDRWVSPSVTAIYCCNSCQLAHIGKYEIHEHGILGHSDFCNNKVKERGTQFARPQLSPLP